MLKWVAQLAFLGFLITVVVIVGRVVASNLSNRGINFGWQWLSDPPGFSIREGIDTTPDSGARALLVGIVNMLRVTVAGIIFATLIGTVIGIARLSNNWIVNKIGTAYVETIRNIPLLVQIFFWQALMLSLKTFGEEDVGTYFTHSSVKGIALPGIFPSDGFWQWTVFVVIGLVAARYVFRWRSRMMEETGHESYALTSAIGTVVVFAAIGWFLHPIFGWMSAIWGALESLARGIPAPLYSWAIALAIVAGAAYWIRGFFAARKTPAGYGKFTDDDIFRVAFAAFAGLAIGGFVIWLSSRVVQVPSGGSLEGDVTIAELIRLGAGNFWNFFENKFHGSAGSPFVFELPSIELRGAGFAQYGSESIVITVPFFAVFVGITVYTAAFIAEVVRAGILAVPRGQTEAASAIGLKRSQYLRLIILPQAFRIILPPMGNQYLNLAKNTSLGTAVAYAEVVAVGFTLSNQTGQSLPIVLTWMVFYLTVSLSISVVVNYYNRKLALVER